MFLLLIFLSPSLISACTLFSGLQTTLEAPQVLCEECGFSGYLKDGVCKCLLPSMDPNEKCFSPGGKNETVVREWEYYKSSCECHHSFEEGFWRLSPSKEKIINSTLTYQWGDGVPPTCLECFNPFYGPAPSLQTYSGTALRVPACGQYGGPNPVYIETGAPTIAPSQLRGLGRRLDENVPWSVCSGNGKWNNTLNGCQCSVGWSLEIAGTGYNNTIIPLCQICEGGWGPLVVPSVPQDDTGLPFCSVIWTPDPLDGVLRECGGNGEFFEGGCICTQSVEGGFWKLGSYKVNQTTLLLVGKEEYKEFVIEYEVLTCQECSTPGDHPPCTGTYSPSGSPTSSPTYYPI